VNRRLLLDTPALIWALSAPRRLPAPVATDIRDPQTDVYVSTVSTWEIAIKSALGKIDADLAAIVSAARAADFDELPITIAHTERLRTLPALHRDPFERLLVAQALEEHLTIVTHDRLIAAYAVARLWG
jgi:PIN domain nuclease of toxin-antitoxin system